MKEKQKTKKQFLEEATELQRNIARLEKSNTMLRKDRNALKEIEQRFQLIAENIQEVFWIRDLEKNRTLYVSPAFEKVFGLARESLYEDADSYKKIIHPDDLDILNKANERRRKGIYTDIQYRITRPDGQLRWITAGRSRYPMKTSRFIRQSGSPMTLPNANRQRSR
jgi:PAS domain S-box-containing protein